MDILSLTALELGKMIKDKKVTAGEAARAAIERAKALEPEIHSYVILELQVVSWPSMHRLSFTATGTPASGPVSVPFSICFCTSAACLIAPSSSRVT